MVSGFDRIVITVPELQAASGQYGKLLDVTPAPQGGREHSCWLGLPNTVIELEQGNVEHASIRGIVFRDSSAGLHAEPLANSLGLELSRCDGVLTDEYRQRIGAADPGLLRVDHLVLHTADAGRCIELFASRLGIRLALDRTVPEWGGRMLFFRVGKLTLEVIESKRNRVDADYFWGIAYQCQDIEETVRQLAGRGVELSGIREGRKPGTRVATLRSHCLGIPSLLIGPAT